MVLVDDGLASGVTMRAALESVRRAGGDRIVIAVPTGHLASLRTLADLTEGIYCANVRGGHRFAVADAYRDWSDVADGDLQTMLHDCMADHR